MSIRPFANGMQDADWTGSNCDRCKKSTANGGDGCEIETALLEAWGGDGCVDDAIAQRMGYAAQEQTWQCPEVDWAEWWKAEFLARKAVSNL